MNNFKLFKQKVEEYQDITIFRHTNSDFDAYGSQLGLKHLLKENYPDKNIYCYGEQDIINPEFIDAMENPSDEIIKQSLSIVLDTSTIDRVTNKFKLAKESFRIDHHPFTGQVCDNEIIDTDASSASQLVLEAAIENEWSINIKAAQFIYAGISTDTVKMTIEKVDSRLFYDLSILLKSGMNVNYVNRMVYDENKELFVARNYLRNQIKFVKDVAYLYISLEEMESYKIDLDEAKGCITLMSNIKGINKWVSFIEDEDHNYYVSLRSHQIPISDVAIKFGGGGHLLASGIHPVTYKQTKEIIELLANKE